MGPFDRHPADDYDPDRQGDWWQDRARMEDTLPRGGEDERYTSSTYQTTVCAVCGKPLAAMADCASCGDPGEMAA